MCLYVCRQTFPRDRPAVEKGCNACVVDNLAYYSGRMWKYAILQPVSQAF